MTKRIQTQRLLQQPTLRDILKKSERKNRFLFSFPGLFAPIGGGKIGELKDLGTKNSVLYLDFPLIVFSDAWWIGTQAENREEAQLDFPKELTEGQHTEYDFKGGAERSPNVKVEDNVSDDGNKDLMRATPVRLSARTAGKRFYWYSFGNASSGDDSFGSDTYLSEGEDENIGRLDSSSGQAC
ncbi:hypothetical protein PRUPE_2G315400 [Prunus persica]|uniref:Uncharacterized protein n=1 Tax=Prunus persica TaxID=3760 RepID=M5XQ67_PRUPE|nr:hypothetical protein PRUPE_2G315400 [Prunus persica]